MIVRDIALLVMLLALGWASFRRPWVGLLALVFVGVMHPQGYVSGFMQGFPAYFALLVVVALSAGWQLFRGRAWPPLFWDWRLAGLALLWGQFVLTTALGINPWAGWPRLMEVSKILPLILLVLLLIDTRVKLNWLLMTVGLSLAAVILKGGYWAFITGFHDRVYGPPGSQYAGNNEFAVATAMAIPLLALWYREADSKMLRWIVAILIALGFASALSSWSRGGLLSISVVALLLVWHSRRKWLAIPLLLMVVGLAVVGLSDEWVARMQTMAAPELEASAATRLELWRLGWDYALQHPWFGGGFGGWIYLTLPVGASRAWHSAYIEIVAEHGFPGLVLWVSLVFGSVVSLSVLIARNRRWQLPGLTDQAAMLRASLAAYLVGAAFLSIAYWELLYLLLACAILLSRFAKVARIERTG
ncbi:MAG: putative O-glycosylation ligase, exosortase A system-associated [Hydrogenophilales bacterium 17-64-65]|nr:MAG: putative O-glycosylation ligase, exosortase A system-associated [Hydrogenophilales bacterium 16-64-40]OZA33983.1 MAG: putative O-glycosylation ligase, exosortase A system-associated [Hydrogenophilales bacterium 17-64-65]